MQLVAPGTREVVLIPQAVQLALGAAEVPPADEVPAGQGAHASPPCPGAQAAVVW